MYFYRVQLKKYKMDYKYLSDEHLTGFENYKVSLIFVISCKACFTCVVRGSGGREPSWRWKAHRPIARGT